MGAGLKLMISRSIGRSGKKKVNNRCGESKKWLTETRCRVTSTSSWHSRCQKKGEHFSATRLGNRAKRGVDVGRSSGAGEWLRHAPTARTGTMGPRHPQPANHRLHPVATNPTERPRQRHAENNGRCGRARMQTGNVFRVSNNPGLLPRRSLAPGRAAHATTTRKMKLGELGSTYHSEDVNGEETLRYQL